MTLETDRLVLRKLCEDDLPGLYELDRDRAVRYFIDDGKLPPPWHVFRDATLAKIDAFSRFGEELGFWSARVKPGRFIGWFHLRPNETWFPGDVEVGYRLRSADWGHGFATEGARALLEYGFARLGLRYIIATALKRNVASVRVMEKTGMRFEREFVVPEESAPYWSEHERAAVKYAAHAPAAP